jgi:hypothetical protein
VSGKWDRDRPHGVGARLKGKATQPRTQLFGRFVGRQRRPFAASTHVISRDATLAAASTRWS